MGHSPGGARWACTARLAAMGTTWHLVLNRSPFAQVEHTTSVAGHLMEIHWPLPPLGSVDPCSHASQGPIGTGLRVTNAARIFNHAGDWQV